MTDIQRADELPELVAAKEVDDLFTSPDIDAANDLLVFEHHGDMVAYGIVEHSPAGTRHERATLIGGVDPRWRRQGLGQRMLTWQLDRAEDRLDATDPRLAAFIEGYAFDFEAGTIGLLERHGFEHVRFDHELGRFLVDLPVVAPIDGITIRPWTDSDHEAARLVSNAAFADHWGSTPRTSESWQHLVDAGGRRLDLSFVAADTASGDVVAICLNSHYPDDQEVTGRLDGWIDMLGTVRSHRKLGIASALVIHSLHRFAAEGFDHAMLGVDSENPTGAYGIYEGLGFAKMHTILTMQRTVRAPTLHGDE